MRSFLLLLIVLASYGTPMVLAQRGGKAEPKEIKFAPHSSAITLKGTLSNGQEMEYVFCANKGQSVTIKNATSRIFDFRVFNEEYFDEGDFDSSPSYAFEIPETADYLFTVRKKIAGPRVSRFSLTITIN
ncbi:MAG: hypothetical protein ACKVQJ_14665 [Pyrinomonadaceae bacterium]